MPWPSPAQNVQALHNPLALIDFDFVNGVYLESGVSSALADAPGWTFSRTTAGYGASAAGALTSFAIDAPRVTDQGLLIEGAATNVIVRSQELNDAAWTKTNAAISANATTAPDGTTTADRLVDDAVNAVHRAFVVPTVTNGQPYDLQAFVKPAGITQIAMIESNLGGGVFNLTGAGSLYSGSGSIEAMADGYYRIEWTKTATAAFWVIQMCGAVNGNTAYSGVGNGLDIWGVDLKLSTGIGPSSYFPTGAAAATRGADVASLAFSGATLATVVYGGGLIVTVPVTTSLNLGASSGGAWVGSYVERVVVR